MRLLRIGWPTSIAACAIMSLAACTVGSASPSPGAATLAPTLTIQATPTATTATPSAAATPIAPRAPTLIWRTSPVGAIPASAAIGGMAARPGSEPLFLAVGVWDWGAAIASAGGNAHLGTVWSSPDGRSWSKAAGIETARMLLDVAYGDGRFVAVGAWSGPADSGSVVLAAYTASDAPGTWTSTDGRRWTATKLDGGATLVRVTFGDAGFLAIGSDPECSQGCPDDYTPAIPIHVSRDGVRWQSTTFTAGLIGDVVAVPGHGYVAIGTSSAVPCPGAIWHSADGLTWSPAAEPPASCFSPAVVATDAVRYLALGTRAAGDVSAAVATSTDGVGWTEPVTIGPAFESSGATGFVDDVLAISTQDAIWEYDPVAMRLNGPSTGAWFAAFADGIGLRVGPDGGLVVLPEPAT